MEAQKGRGESGNTGGLEVVTLYRSIYAKLFTILYLNQIVHGTKEEWEGEGSRAGIGDLEDVSESRHLYGQK